jgi:hypothetical protein
LLPIGDCLIFLNKNILWQVRCLSERGSKIHFPLLWAGRKNPLHQMRIWFLLRLEYFNILILEKVADFVKLEKVAISDILACGSVSGIS